MCIFPSLKKKSRREIVMTSCTVTHLTFPSLGFPNGGSSNLPQNNVAVRPHHVEHTQPHTWHTAKFNLCPSLCLAHQAQLEGSGNVCPKWDVCLVLRSGCGLHIASTEQGPNQCLYS